MHIEHSINSYGGCSGAIIFLLDKDQPHSIRQNNYGKAIAVHAGSSSTLQHNLGLRLCKLFHFPRPVIVAGIAVAGGTIATSGCSRGR